MNPSCPWPCWPWPGCPWNNWQPAVLSFCEENLCAWIRQPANTWSNLGFVFVTGLILWQQRRSPARSGALRLMPWLSLLIGLMSGIYHASMTFAGEFLDLGSMFLLSAMILTFNMKRKGWIRPERWLAAYVGLVLFSMGLMLVVKTSGIHNFAAQIIGSALIEVSIVMHWRRQSRGNPRGEPPAVYRNLFAAVGFLAVAYGIWNLDFHRLVCEPTNHVIQGHAIWHILDAVAFYFIYRFFRQFDGAWASSSRNQSLST